METIPKNPLLEYNPDTLQYLRELYGFDQQRMKDSIDLLEEWIKKQEHFTKKTFPREYLERIIIHNKGSVEKSKKKLDKLFTLRTLVPEFFINDNAREISLSQDVCDDYLVPKMTPDHCRIHIIKVRDRKFTTYKIYQHFIYFLLVADYQQAYDYCNGLIVIGDWRDGSAFDYAMQANISDFRKCLDISLEAYSMRIIGIHLISESKAVEAFVALLKKAVSPKIGDRIYTHKSIETIYEHVPKEILPVEYGGNEKPLAELHENLLTVFESDDFQKYRRDVNEARTDESYRPKDIFNEYMGMSGTFRNLAVD